MYLLVAIVVFFMSHITHNHHILLSTEYLNVLLHFCLLIYFLNTQPAIAPAGLRSSALLALLLSNESASESELCPLSPEYSQEISTATDASSLPGSTAAICSPSSPKYKVRKVRVWIPMKQHNITLYYINEWCLWKILLLLQKLIFPESIKVGLIK